MGEGARRAGEGSSSPAKTLLNALLSTRKSPHPAFGHLLPRVPRGRRENEVSHESRWTKIDVHPCSCRPLRRLRKFSPDSPAACGRRWREAPDEGVLCAEASPHPASLIEQ